MRTRAALAIVALTLTQSHAATEVLAHPEKQLIEELWMVTQLNAYGQEEILQAPVQDHPCPVALIAADKPRLDSMIPVAKNIAKRSGQPVRLIKFVMRTEVEEIKP